MKTAYYWYIIAAIALLGVILGVSKKGPSFSATTPQGTVSTQTPAVNSDATPIKTPVSPATSVNASAKINAVTLPIYYSEQIASTTLEIHVTNPYSNTIVASPLSVTGEARGSWFFEASFPIALTDDSGKTIASGHVTAKNDWMTTNFVPFTATLTFPKQKTGTKGWIVLRNDNPSGLAKNEKAVKIGVTF